MWASPSPNKWQKCKSEGNHTSMMRGPAFVRPHAFYWLTAHDHTQSQRAGDKHTTFSTERHSQGKGSGCIILSQEGSEDSGLVNLPHS